MKHILTGNQKAAVVGEQKSMLSSESKIVALRTALLSILMLLVMTASAASSVEGYWKSVDEQTGKASGYWRLELVDSQLLGYVINYPGMKSDDICMACRGDLQEFLEKPIRGTAWINLSKNRDGVWKDGYIIDSGQGKKYKAEIWVEDGDLKMRGYIGFFYRTQTWLRTDQAAAEQATFGE